MEHLLIPEERDEPFPFRRIAADCPLMRRIRDVFPGGLDAPVQVLGVNLYQRLLLADDVLLQEVCDAGLVGDEGVLTFREPLAVSESGVALVGCMVLANKTIGPSFSTSVHLSRLVIDVFKVKKNKRKKVDQKRHFVAVEYCIFRALNYTLIRVPSMDLGCREEGEVVEPPRAAGSPVLANDAPHTSRSLSLSSRRRTRSLSVATR